MWKGKALLLCRSVRSADSKPPLEGEIGESKDMFLPRRLSRALSRSEQAFLQLAVNALRCELKSRVVFTRSVVDFRTMSCSNSGREANLCLAGEAKRLKMSTSTNGTSSSQSAAGRRSAASDQEQIPIKETISLREKFVGRSCKLFYREDPIKFVRAKGATSIFYVRISRSIQPS